MRIERIFAKNFCSFKEAEVKFGKENVIFLEGENSAGKSAFSIILAILASNYKGNKQSAYIRHATRGYKIGVETDEGIEITQERFYTGRGKSKATKVRWLAKKGDILLYTNEVNGTLLAIDDVPDSSDFSIKKYLNFILEEETGELLNYRTRTSNKLFLETSGGANYKILNGVLHYDLLEQTQKRLNEQLNAKNVEFNRIKEKKSTLTDTLNSLNVVPVEVLSSYKKIIDEYAKIKEQAEGYNEIEKLVVELSDISVPPNVEEIDERELKQLEELTIVIDRQKELQAIDNEFPPEVEEEIEGTEQLAELRGLIERAKGIEREPDYPEEIEMISVEQIEEMESLKGKLQEWLKTYEEAQNNIKAEREYQAYKDEVLQICKEVGMSYCPSCGYVGKAEHTHS